MGLMSAIGPEMTGVGCIHLHLTYDTVSTVKIFFFF